MRVYNFSAGPATMPLEVLERAQKELLDWQGLGMSVMEISHRSPEYMALVRQIEANLRELLNIPEEYAVLFMQGGGRAQFSMVALNLLGDKKEADYVDSGIWSTMAIAEAKRYCQVNIVASSAATGYRSIPPYQDWQCNPNAAYLHYTSNETIGGAQFFYTPETSVPLVSDMSSDFLSRPIDIEKHGLIYAAAQKNLGMAGITIVIIKKSLLGKALEFTPSLYNYQTYANTNSLYNTPPTYPLYFSGLVLEWIKKQGGVEVIAEKNKNKAEILYNYIDQSGFYVNSTEPQYRSRMNIPFFLPDDKLNMDFLVEAKGADLIGLKGHSLVGGMRASIYNAMPVEGVRVLIDFMRNFAKRHG